MKNMWKRVLSFALALVMVFGMMPAEALANELDNDESVVTPTEEHTHAHEGAVTTAATCEAEGVMTYTCSCGDTYTEAIAALGHSYEEGVCACGATKHTHAHEGAVTNAATCEAEGVMTYTCSCGDTYTEAIAALGHSYEEGVCACGATEPTEAPSEEATEEATEEVTEEETEEETEEAKAELSGETRKIYYYNVESWDEVWAAWSFDEEDFDDVAHPGEEMDGETALENVWVIRVPVEADEVLFSDGIEVTEELLEQERLAGVTVTHEEEVRLEDDEFYDLYQDEEWANYAKAVKALEETEAPAEHTCSYEGVVTKEATCEAEGEMTYACTCGDSYTKVIAAIGHNYEDTQIAPTCEAAGEITYTCVNCGDSNTEVMPALGHEYAEGKCTRCGAADPVTEVQDMYDALDLQIDDQADADALFDAVCAADEAWEALPPEQQALVDTAKSGAAWDAIAAFNNPEVDDWTTWAGESYNGTTASFAMENGDYVLSVKNGSGIIKDELYQAFKAALGVPGNNSKDGAFQIIYANNTVELNESNQYSWQAKATTSLTDGTVSVKRFKERTGDWWNYTYTYDDAVTFTVKIYDVLTINTTVGAETTTETIKVYRNVPYSLAVADKSSDSYTKVDISGAVQGTTAGNYTVQNLSGDATVNIVYKKNTDNSFMPGSVAADVKVTVNGNELTSAGVTVNASTAATLEATYTGSDKNTYVNTVVVKSGETTAASGTSSASLTTAEVATTYTVDVTTADAITLSGTEIQFNNTAAYTVWEQAIKDLVTVCGADPENGSLTITYYTGNDLSGYKSLNYTASTGLAHNFGANESETVRIVCGNYTWQGTIKLIEARTEATVTYNETAEVFMNGYYSAADQESELTAEILEKVVTSSNHDGNVTITVQETGTISGWFPISDFKDNITSIGKTFDVNQTKSIKISWADSETFADKEIQTSISVKESRNPATVTLGTVSGTYNTVDDFKAAVTNAVSVKDNNGADCKANAGLTVTLNPVEGKTNTYTVSYSLSKAGATWLTTSGTFKNAEDKEVEVVWAVTQVNAIWNANGGKWSDNTTANKTTQTNYNNAPTAPADPTREHYTFSGWTPAIDKITEETTYTAQWTPVNYTITWVNGDETTTSTVAYGTTAGALTAMAPAASKTSTAQYHFTNGNWGAIAPVTGDATYTATFTEELRSYTITWVNGDETTHSYDVPYGTTAEALTAMAPAASKSANETYTYENGTWGTIAPVTGEATYTATFTPVYIEYTILWDVNGNGGADEGETVNKLHYGDDIDAPKNPTKDGYNFVGWDVDGNNTIEQGETLPETVTGNATFTAVFDAKPTYKVEVNYGLDLGTTEDTVIEGNTFEIPAEPTKVGYRFDGWDITPAAEIKDGKITITANTTITAKWVKTYTYKYETEHGTAPAGATVDVNTNITVADLLEQGNLTDGIKMTGWYVGETLVSGNYTITGDVTFTAKWEADADNDNIVDGSAEDPYWTIKIQNADGTYSEQTNVLNGESYATPAAIDKDNAIFVEWTKTVEGTTVTFTAVWNNNDANNNNVDDTSETASITVNVTGNGTVSLAAAEGATLTKNENGTYTLLFDSREGHETTKVVTVIATPAETSKVENQTTAYFVVSNPGTVTVSNGANEIAVEFGSLTGTNSIQVGVNGYVIGKLGYDDYSARLEGLKAKVLNGVFGVGKYNADDYTVSMYAEYDLTHNWTPGYKNVENELGGYFVTLNVTEKFQVKHNATNVVIDVDGSIYDDRAEIDPASFTVSEQQDLGAMTADKATADMKVKLGLDISLTGTKITAGALPVNAGEETSVTYSASFAGDATYQPVTITITYEKVYKAYNDCTVIEGGENADKGSVKVNNAAADSSVVTVPGNSNVTVEVTPSGNNVVETITVTKNGVTLATFTTTDITYSNKKATVSFKSDGATKVDEYVVSATYSEAKMVLNENATIVYCLDNDGKDVLKGKIFEALYNAEGSNPKVNLSDVTIEYYNITWRDVTKDPSINLGSLTHKFGEKGTETVRITYKDDKYGTVQSSIVLNVFDSCYCVKVEVQTITNGAEASIKQQFNADTKEYKGVKYFKAGTDLTVTLTPDGKILDVLGRLYNGTYGDSMAYIKDVRVYERGNETPISGISVVRGQGKLDLGSILQGVNPMLYNASVTFTLDADKDYFVVVEYGIHKLEKQKAKVTLPMYQGGKKYEAEVPSTQEIINAILGEEYAATFLATYGGAFTVEFSTDLISYNWAAVSDDALLALKDGTTVKVRITWKPTDGDKTYYPVAQQADLTLVDGRTSTYVKGEVPTKQVNFISEDKLIAELKEAMGLGILANDAALDVEYDVTYTLKGNETDGFTADVTVTYDGSAEYKPTTKTFENVPVANRPDDATIKITVENASAVVTNNDGKEQPVDSETGIYTVIGNGTYSFKLAPAADYAIESVTVNGEKIPVKVIVDEAAAAAVETGVLSYSKQTATFSLVLTEKEHYEIVVETVPSVWELEAEPTYDFATGITKPDNSNIVEAVTTYPADIDFEKVELQYLARAEGKVTVTMPSFEVLGQNVDLGTFDVDLGELWLNPEESVDLVAEDQLDKILENLTKDVLEKILSGDLRVTNALNYVTDYIKNLPLGIHAFGAGGDGSTETIRFSYEDDKYLLAEVKTDVTIHDYRTPTEIVANDCEVTFGYSLDQLVAASGAYVAADGAAVSGLKIETNGLYKHVKAEAQEINLFFAGDATYQPSKVTINVTVKKAACDIDYDSQRVTYGDAYDFALHVSPAVMPDGTEPEIDRIEFMIGLDMHKLLDVDFEDKDVGIDQAIGYIQLRLPESIRELPLVGQYLQGEFTLGEFTELINGLSGALGIDENSVGILNQVLGAITGVTDNMDIKVVIKGEDFKPKNIGVYIAGAVTIDADFETAYTADYLLITPNTIEAQLAWDYTDENGIMTLPTYNEIYKELMGAHVVENEVMTGDTLATANDHIKYLILGINNETSEFLYTDVHGNIKANIWTSNDAISDNGAYVQIAYMLNWGNEIYYAMPIVRSFLIVPALYDVQLVGATGEPNDELLKTFNNEQQGFSVIVKDNKGNVIYSDHYQNVVALKENAQLVVNYVGVQTNGQPYNSNEKPVHAGVYAATAIYMEFNDGEKLDISNLDVEDLYELFDLADIGADMGLLVIEPAESTINVEDKIVAWDGTHYKFSDQVLATSAAAENLNPDKTIISAGINTDGDFSENGWAAVGGTVNVDFPRWIDELIAQYAPSVVEGISVKEFSDKLVSKLPSIAAKLEELGATNETLNALSNAVTSVAGALENVPENVKLSFNDDAYASSVGAYVIIGIVTDSDHIPSVDAGLLVIAPDVNPMELKWNYEDEDNIWTRELLKFVDLNATAYSALTGEYNETATEMITHKFIGIDKKGDLIVTDTQNADDLPNGAYFELAYIKLDVDGAMTVSNLIARPILIVPGTVEVAFVDAPQNNTWNHIFDNTPKGVEVLVTNNGKVVEPKAGELTVTYTGIQTNGKIYRSTEAPVHAGAYTVAAEYVEYTAGGSLANIGATAGFITIAPAEATVNVADSMIVDFLSGKSYDLEETMVTVGSAVPNLKPDTTIISAQINTDGAFSENGWAAVNGNVNVDFPRWMDELLAEQVPSIKDGITAAELKAKLTAKLPDILSKLEELGATNEIINSLNNLVGNLNKVLAQIPDNMTLTFKDDVVVSSVGAYAVAAIVTDSDHIPAADAGVLVILPDVDVVDLKWNHEDTNNIWTRELLGQYDLWAKAYDKESGELDAGATAVIHYQFIGMDKNGSLLVIDTDNANDLPNGVYTELAYIELEIDGHMYISDLIARTVIIVPNAAEVKFVDVNGNNARRFVFDNTQKTMDVTVALNGKVITPADGTLTFTYNGIQTNGKTYNSTTAPVHAGIYTVLAEYADYTEGGSLAHYGAAAGIIAIEPAASTMDVTGGTVTYDGKGHTATVVATGSGVTEPDYTLISGGAYVSGNINEVGVDAFHGNVNIDFPAWLDKALAEHEFKTEGVDTAYLTDFISSYRDDALALIPVETLVKLGVAEKEINAYIAKLNSYIDELLAVLEKLPAGVALTFNDDVTYSEPGCYLFYGIVTDSDHYPAADTGLLVIEKKDILFDLKNTTVSWNGEGQMVDMENPENADFVTVVIDRKNNTANIILDEDAQYVLNAVAKLLGVEFDGDVQMSTILDKYNGKEVADAIVKLIDEAQKLELTEEIRKVLADIKTELETLPTSGTITVNGELPSELGEYEFYAISYSQHFKTVASEAVLTIVKAQDNDWVTKPGIEGWTYGDEPNAPTGESKYGEVKVEYRPANGTDADYTEKVPTDAGEYIVRFTVEETGNYNGISTEVKLTIAKATPDVSVPEGLTATYGQTLADVTLPKGFTWADDATTSVGNAGENKFWVVYTPEDTDNYESVRVEVAVDVAKATPEVSAPDGLTATYGQTLADVTLPEGFTWADDATTSVGNAGENKFWVVYTPEDTDNYESVRVEVAVDVAKATPDVSAPSGLTATVGQTLADVTLPEGFAWADAVTTPVGDAGDNVFDVIFTPEDTDNYKSVQIQVTITVTDAHSGQYPIYMTHDDAHGIYPGATVYVDGIAYTLDDDLTVYVDTDESVFVTTYVFNTTSTDPHDVYPTNMYVWELAFRGDKNGEWAEDEHYTAERIEEFDDIMSYIGCSIRVTGKKGIRMKTGIPTDIRNKMIADNVLGWQLMQTGTCVEWADSEGYMYNNLTLATNPDLTGYAYKRGVQDPVFARAKGRDQYTNVLVGFNNDQCKDDLVMRPYMILKNVQTGEQAVLYGAPVQRSIGYIAYQNRLVYDPGHPAYDFLWDIIHHVYGTQYDADFKG